MCAHYLGRWGRMQHPCNSRRLKNLLSPSYETWCSLQEGKGYWEGQRRECWTAGLSEGYKTKCIFPISVRILCLIHLYLTLSSYSQDLTHKKVLTMSNLTYLRKLAQVSNPQALPQSVLFTHTPTSLTIFDAYPKSIFHFLILPRPVPPLSVSDLANLRTLLKSDKARAKDVLLGLRQDALTMKGAIEDEMMSRYGFKWGVWIGFHAVPSME
jgi:hypothetical protein